MDADWRGIEADYRTLCHLLTDDAIMRCANRQDLRLQTGVLLEDAFMTLAIACAPDLAVEIGAHEASFSLRMKQARPQTSVIAFEANPHVFENFRNLPEFAERGIEYRHTAISAANGFAEFHIPTRWPKGEFKEANRISSLAPRADTTFEHRMVRVPAQTLDDALVPNNYSNAVAWIDVEGGQREVLAGATAFLSRATALFIEVETTEVWAGQCTDTEITALLDGYGFFPVLRDTVASVQFNQIYLNRNKDISGVAAPVVRGYINQIETAIRASGTGPA